MIRALDAGSLDVAIVGDERALRAYPKIAGAVRNLPRVLRLSDYPARGLLSPPEPPGATPV
jgi:hypothetical protein